MESELTVIESGLMKPVATLEELKQAYQLKKDFIESVLVEGVDFGVIPGTGSKPVLLKPGAEKVTTLYGLQTIFVLDEKIEDWTGKDHNGEPFFYYRYNVDLMKGNVIMANSQGSANSWEKKYRYRTAELKCPQCENEGTIIKGKEEYGGGWLCWAKKGGCGAKFLEMDPEIVDQERGTVINPNPYDVVNTLQKMAQKRAMVAAALIVGNVSDFFTQDLEDLDYGVVVTEVQPKKEVIDVDVETGEVIEKKTTKLKKKPAPEQKQEGPKLTAAETKAIKMLKSDHPEVTPESAFDWAPAYKYVDGLEEVSRKDLMKIVTDKGRGDVRIGMCHMLGYLD